jgi:hypothetical protein
MADEVLSFELPDEPTLEPVEANESKPPPISLDELLLTPLEAAGLTIAWTVITAVLLHFL